RFVLSFPQNSSSATYAAHVHCTWTFKYEHPVELHFSYIDLQNASQVSGKCLDYLQLKSQYASYATCGYLANYTIDSNIISKDSFKLTFHSDDSIEGRGFEVIIERAGKCNRTYTSLSGRLTYTSNAWTSRGLCNDTIVVPEEYNLNFYFQYFGFSHYNCTKLHFRISELKTNKTIYERCRNSYKNVEVYTNTNAVRIEASEFSAIPMFYVSSERNLIPGCGGSLPFTDGIIASPHYENDRNYSECRWNITVPSPNVILINFQSFNMGPITNCHLDNVQVYDIMPDGSEKLLQTFCGPDIPNDLTSTSSRVAIISKKSPNFDGTDWSVVYRVHQH
uniref:CUB domain-containing protein n=1 Tax=Stomoxys calcitrans TaxID=35570 RepID=A0A1I8PW59_STOCA